MWGMPSLMTSSIKVFLFLNINTASIKKKFGMDMFDKYWIVKKVEN